MIRDKNRIRKTYSFFRPTAVPNVDLTSDLTSDEDMLKLTNLAALSAEDSTNLSSGQLAYVQTLRDVFVYDPTYAQGSVDGITIVSASPSGRWYRLSLTDNMWINKLSWHINGTSGNDEGEGTSSDPIRTHDELTRRCLAKGVIVDDMSVHLTGSVIQAITGIRATLNGGSLAYYGTVTSSIAGALAGTLTEVLTASVYDSGRTSRLTLTGGGFSSTTDYGLLGTHNGTTYSTIGWNTSASGDTLFTSHHLYSASVTTPDLIYSSTFPQLKTPAVIVTGPGTVTFKNLELKGDDNSIVIDPYRFITNEAPKNTFVFSCTDGAGLGFDVCNITGSSISFLGSTTEIFVYGTRFKSNPSDTLLFENYDIDEFGSLNLIDCRMTMFNSTLYNNMSLFTDDTDLSIIGSMTFTTCTSSFKSSRIAFGPQTSTNEAVLGYYSFFGIQKDSELYMSSFSGSAPDLGSSGFLTRYPITLEEDASLFYNYDNPPKLGYSAAALTLLSQVNSNGTSSFGQGIATRVVFDNNALEMELTKNTNIPITKAPYNDALRGIKITPGQLSTTAKIRGF